jgi:hypothetical protein
MILTWVFGGNIDLFEILPKIVDFVKILVDFFKQVFNSKLDRISILHRKWMVGVQPLLELKTWPRSCPFL